ncbi:hypothetical protein J6590_033932 [Homalodisca vitripennis]|nr:hypothetical protein J6590_033932 [Homalodisca vitripennis]
MIPTRAERSNSKTTDKYVNAGNPTISQWTAEIYRRPSGSAPAGEFYRTSESSWPNGLNNRIAFIGKHRLSPPGRWCECDPAVAFGDFSLPPLLWDQRKWHGINKPS